MTQLGIIIRQTFKFTKDLPLSNSIIFSLGFMQSQVFNILYPKRKLIINSHFLAFIVGMYKTEQNRKHYLRLLPQFLMQTTQRAFAPFSSWFRWADDALVWCSSSNLSTMNGWCFMKIWLYYFLKNSVNIILFPLKHIVKK